MEPIIPPLDKTLLEEELAEAHFVRNTNNGHNKIFIFTAHSSPSLMREVGRLREDTFRDAGGGTGKAIDIDEYDTAEKPFIQLIVWNPVEKDIVGGYRFIHGKNIPCNDHGALNSATAELFDYSDHFVRDYLPVSIELGRSFVQPEYQPTINFKKGMYSLDNLWDGLGAMIIDNPDIQYFFGKMTMYPEYNRTARDIILYFLRTYFPDNEKLMMPKKSVKLETDERYLEDLFTGADYQENYKILVHEIHHHNEHIPPLVNAYMNLSPTMTTFGTAINHEFGEVEETGIMIKIPDIYPRKKERHLTTYMRRFSSWKNIKLRRKK
jgi:Acetyltransferase (GNAT) domain